MQEGFLEEEAAELGPGQGEEQETLKAKHEASRRGHGQGSEEILCGCI